MEAKHYIESTPETFDSDFKKGLVGVAFYAPWCGHCHDLLPKWNDVARVAKFMKFFIYNASDFPAPDGIEIEGFPTIIFYFNGNKIEEYSGSRDTNVLLEYCKKLAQKYKPL